MKINKLAGLGIASFVLFGSLGEIAPAQALQSKQVNTTIGSSNSLVASNDFVIAKKILKVKYRRRHHSRSGFRHNKKRNFRRGFRKNFNRGFINHGRRNHRNHVKFDNTFSTGNDFHERFVRVRLF